MSRPYILRKGVSRLEDLVNGYWGGVIEPTRGNLYFVDTVNGNSGNTGLEPEEALDTITGALEKCVADRRDTIYVLRWDTDNGETWPLPMNKARVTLRGAPAGGPEASSQAYITSVGNYSAVTISANYCRLLRLYLACASASYDAIGFSSVPGGTGIIGCNFGVCKDAIGGGVAAASTIGWTSQISDCYFTAQCAAHGIYVYNPAQIMIARNVFKRTVGVALQFAGPSGYGRILDNRFGLASDTKGLAITMGATSYGCVFDGNRANFGNSAMSNNPYLDPGTTYKNDWLLNYMGVTATMPATS